MFGPHNQTADNDASRRREAAHYGPEQDSGQNAMQAIDPSDISRLMRSASVGASYNAPTRASAMQGLQQTHGNRAVQRTIGTGGFAGRVPVQRDVAVQDEQQVNPASSFMYQPQPFAPIPSPMNGFGGTLPFGPVVATTSASEPVYSSAPAPVYGPQLEGGVSTMEDGEVCEMPDIASNGAVVQANNSGESSSDFGIDDVNNLVSAGTTAANTMMMGSSVFKGLPKVAKDFNVLSLAKGGSSALNTGTSALGVGLGIYNFINADNTTDRVQAGADTLASGAGFAGPVGMAFSGGYSAGQLLDNGADWIGDKIWGDGDHSLHHGIAEHVLPNYFPPAQDIRDLWEVLHGRGTEAQQEEQQLEAEKKAEVEAYRRVYGRAASGHVSEAQAAVGTYRRASGHPIR